MPSRPNDTLACGREYVSQNTTGCPRGGDQRGRPCRLHPTRCPHSPSDLRRPSRSRKPRTLTLWPHHRGTPAWNLQTVQSCHQPSVTCPWSRRAMGQRHRSHDRCPPRCRDPSTNPTGNRHPLPGNTLHTTDHLTFGRPKNPDYSAGSGRHRRALDQRNATICSPRCTRLDNPILSLLTEKDRK